MSDKILTGAEDKLWDLSGLYESIADPQIDQDLKTFVKKAKAFEKNFKGKLSTKLGAALKAKIELELYINKLLGFTSLTGACDQASEDIRSLDSKLMEAIMGSISQHFTFFELEIGKLDKKSYEKQLKANKDVAHHKPMLDKIRQHAKYKLDEGAEQMSSLLFPFGPNEWEDFAEEMEAEIRIPFQGKEITLTEALHTLTVEKDAELRNTLLRSVNAALKTSKQDVFYSRALNVMMGQKAAMDNIRGYKHSMSSRNLSNNIEDSTVDALHEAVKTTGVEAGKRYYKLLSSYLNNGEVKPLEWSDRSAPFPLSDTSIIPWKDATSIINSAYSSFSPTLAELVAKILKNNWVDVPAYKGKRGGAFDSTFPTKDGVFSFNFLNYQGSNDDVATLAHELGHGVHGLLAIEKQGALQWSTPMSYAETASTFGEMITFNYLLERCQTDEERLSMLMEKLSNFMNTVVRQINFSVFEQRIHALRKNGKLKVADFNKIWMETTEEFYGKNGEVFNYDAEIMDSAWSYIPHFMSPFYVYSYAFGELFVQGLYAVKDTMGDEFEPKYLDLLRAGGTKDAVALMEPFGLNPNDPIFWQKGMEASALKWLDEAEEITARLQKTKKAS